jgi:hypothetical protein
VLTILCTCINGLCQNTVERREARLPPLREARHPAGCLVCSVASAFTRVFDAPCRPRVSADTRRLSALRPPLDRDGQGQSSGAKAPRERDGLFDIVRRIFRSPHERQRDAGTTLPFGASDADAAIGSCLRAPLPPSGLRGITLSQPLGHPGRIGGVNRARLVEAPGPGRTGRAFQRAFALRELLERELGIHGAYAIAVGAGLARSLVLCADRVPAPRSGMKSRRLTTQYLPCSGQRIAQYCCAAGFQSGLCLLGVIHVGRTGPTSSPHVRSTSGSCRICALQRFDEECHRRLRAIAVKLSPKGSQWKSCRRFYRSRSRDGRREVG